MRNLVRFTGDGGWGHASSNTDRKEDLPVYVNIKLCSSDPGEGFTHDPEMSPWPLKEVFGYLTIGEAVALGEQLLRAAYDAQEAANHES